MSTYYLFGLLSDNTTALLGTPGVGSGTARLYEGDALYIYSIYGILWTSRTSGSDYENIIPVGVPIITSICQAAVSSTSMLNDTIVFSGVNTKYQKSKVETSGGWITAGALSTGFIPIDAVSDPYATVPAILAGNSNLGTEAGVMRSGGPEPYVFTRSDTGFVRDGTSATDLITDLEIAN